MCPTSDPHRVPLAAWCLLAVVLAGGVATAQESPTVGNEPEVQAQPVPTVRAAPAEPEQPPVKPIAVSRLLIVVGPLAAATALMGIYWLILRSGAV